MPALAAQPSAAVMPGTTSTATPAATSASISSPPRPNTSGSPPFNRTTLVTARHRQHLGRDQPVVDHDIGALQQAMRLEGQQIGIARPGADEMDHALRR